MKKNGLSLSLAALLPVAVVLALVPIALRGSDYYMRLSTLMLIYMAYAVAFNIIFGHTRQLFLCLGALAGASAYLSVVLTKQLGISPWLTIPLGVVLSGLLGGLFSYVSVRRGLGVIFVGIVTLTFSLIFFNLVLGLRQFTNGETGMVTSGLGVGVLETSRSSYYVMLAVLLFSLVLYQFLMGSRAGAAFRALSDDELAAELVGIDVTRYKVLAATLGSSLIGLVGALYAYYSGFISPTIYSLVNVDIVALVTLLLGGIGTLLGPVIGGVLFSVLNEVVRPLGQINVLVYGALMIVLFITFRQGLVAVLRKVVGVRIP